MMVDIGKDLQKAYDEGYEARDSEIVRCKDCKYHDFYDNHHSCVWHGFADVKPDWYCADGERREVGQTD